MTHNDFPAVIVGGPPHSGKSVLVYSLTRALRAARVPHYVLRACPDGEGDWANEADQALVQTIRVKGEFTADFTEKVAGYLQQRHLPLLVDVGGMPTAEQEAVFALATHAILLVAERAEAPEAYAKDVAHWQAMMARQGVPVIAQMKSVLAGEDQLVGTAPMVTGVLSGLERGQQASGPAFAALVARLRDLFHYDEATLTARHLARAPVEITLDLPALARTFGAEDGYWRPSYLPRLWSYLPAGKPLAGYGRAPNWVYATVALVAQPAPVWLFDARLGWIEPPPLPVQDGPVEDAARQPGWAVSLRETASATVLEMTTHSQYLDIDDANRLPLPAVPTAQGVVLSGKIPHWLLMAVVRRWGPRVPWTAVYQPPLGGAVVIDSRQSGVVVGNVITLPQNGSRL